jgi:hypothetical protein
MKDEKSKVPIFFSNFFHFKFMHSVPAILVNDSASSISRPTPSAATPASLAPFPANLFPIQADRTAITWIGSEIGKPDLTFVCLKNLQSNTSIVVNIGFH